MHLLTKQLLGELAHNGLPVVLTEDLDDLIDLDRLAHAQSEPEPTVALDLLDIPLEVHGIRFWRLSWYAIQWYDNRALPWWRDNDGMLLIALAWAMAHARDPEPFDNMGSEKQAALIIKLWARKLRGCVDQVALVVQTLQPTTSSLKTLTHKWASKSKAKRTDSIAAPYADSIVLARLKQEFGGTDADWLFCPYDRVMGAFDLLAKQDEDMRKAEAKAKDAAIVTASKWAVESFVAFREAAKAFKEKLEARRG